MTEPFSIRDRRSSQRTASGIHLPGANWDATANNLRSRGYTLPTSGTQARLQARQVVSDVRERGTVADVQNKAAMHAMRADRLKNSRMAGGGMQRTGANVQMVLPKVRQPLSSLIDKGIPFQTDDPKELMELRRWCSSPRSPVWMGDYSFKPIGEIEPGEQVIGWEDEVWQWDGHPTTRKRRQLVRSTVLAVNRRMAPEVVKITFASGRTAECTPDHEWLRYYIPNSDGRITNGPESSLTKRYDSDYAPLKVGSVARSVIIPTEPLTDPNKIAAAHYLAGMFDGDGTWRQRSIKIYQSEKKNPEIVKRIDWALDTLGMTYTRHVRSWGKDHRGGEMVVWELCRGDKTDRTGKNRQQLVNFYNWAHPAKFDFQHMDTAWLTKNFGEPDVVISVESLGPGEVVSMQTTTGNYTAWGYASRNCRLFYSTHDLVPLLLDIYSSFPVQGMELQCQDKKVEEFFTGMFLDELDYGEFLPNGLMREYFMVGEATSLAHFNEQLGTWSSEELLNPDWIRISKSLFVEQERVQLMPKALVESLRDGPQGMASSEESHSERLERTFEYQQLVKHYPEIIKAAQQDDGLDISDALVSRMVNKAAWWDLRGTPHLLRSFRTLMLEESLNAAQDAVCDRLYAPLIVATLGIEGAMGDGEPWIPDQGELEDLRDDIQAALAADFKLIVHNFGLSINPVFGRESVPRFDQDYDRVDAKLMQAWGIGQALIMGGSGAGTYASSAINREVCEQLMKSAQNKAIKHMRKRMEVIAEAQEFYDFELKGGKRMPVYEHIEEYNEETGEKEIVKVPKLLIPDVRFATLNLRDEATERSFIAQLKQMGVPVSDKSLAINIPFEFEEELERQSQETVDKGRAQAEAMGVLQEMLDEEGLPYPMELAQHLEATLGVRAMLAQTEAAETQNKMMDQQLAQASPAGMMGLLPGTTMQPLAGGGAVGMAGDPTAGAAPGGPPPPDPAAGPAPNADPTLGQGHPAAQLTATMHGPRMWPPGGEVEPPEDTMSISDIPRNRNRPEESDEKRGEMPKKVGGRRKKVTALPGRGEPDPVIVNSRFTKGPSSYRQSRNADQRRVERAVRRREVLARGGPTVAELVFDPDFYHVLHADGDQAALEADWPEIEAGRGGQSRRLLEELIEQYEAITGIAPRWE